MELITKITVDLIKVNRFTVVNAKQKDTGRGIEVTLMANGVLFALKDTDTVNIYVTKPDGHVCYNACEISDSKAIVPLTTQTLAVAGNAKCEIEVIRGDSRLTNPAFTLQIFPTNTDEEAVLSEDEIGVVASLASAIAVERARINALTRLEEGSTTGDAELQDIRVGYDGTEYESAGEAVRGQIGQLSEQIENVGKPTDEQVKKSVSAYLTENPVEIDSEQIESSVETWLDEHPEATATVVDGSITEEKLSDDLLNTLKSVGYVEDSEGNKYAVKFADGVVFASRIYEVTGQDALVRDYEVVDGVVMDLVTGTAYTGVSVTDGHMLDPEKNIEVLPVADLFPNRQATVEVLFKLDNKESGSIFKSNYYGFAGFDYGYEDFSGEVSAFTCNIRTVISPSFTAGTISAALRGIIRRPNVLPIRYGDYYYISFTIDDNAFNYSFTFNDVTAEYNRTESGGFFETSGLNRLDLFMLGAQSTKFVKMYNRILTAEERLNNFVALLGRFKKDALESMVTNGVVGLGSAVAVKKEGDDYRYFDTAIDTGDYTHKGANHDWEYTISPFTDPVREVNENYTSLTIVNKRTEAEVGKKFALTAFPFPANLTDESSDDFNIEWESSDLNVALVVHGLVVPVAEGEVTITARLTGTEITDSVTITVSTEVEQESKVWAVSESSLENSPRKNWENICNSIQDAADAGYTKILFPSGKDVWVFPPDEPFIVPSNVCIDFNGCNLRVVDSARSQSGYIFFKFADCKNSKIVNLNLYGERTDTANTESYYSEQIKFLVFDANAVNCWIEDSHFYNPCGFNITTGARWSFWSGKPDYTNGQIYYTDFSFGRIADDGTTEEATDWIVTDFKEFSTDETFKRFYIGCSDSMGQGFSQRLSDVAFYNGDKALITIMRNVYRYESHLVPEGAKYWKFSVASDALPTKNNNYADDNCVLRMAKSLPAIDCGVKNCSFFNTASGGISLCGESTNFHVENCYIDGNGKKNAWAYDPEDGWYRIRHTIVDNCVIKGLSLGSGHGNFYVSSHFGSIRIRSDSEQTTIMNSVIADKPTIAEKWTGLFANNVYNSDVTESGQGRFIHQDNTQLKTYY